MRAKYNPSRDAWTLDKFANPIEVDSECSDSQAALKKLGFAFKDSVEEQNDKAKEFAL